MNEDDLLREYGDEILREYGVDKETKHLERRDRLLGRIQMLTLAPFVIAGVVVGIKLQVLHRGGLLFELALTAVAFTAFGIVILKLTQPLLRALFLRKTPSIEAKAAERDFRLR